MVMRRANPISASVNYAVHISWGDSFKRIGRVFGMFERLNVRTFRTFEHSFMVKYTVSDDGKNGQI